MQQAAGSTPAYGQYVLLPPVVAAAPGAVVVVVVVVVASAVAAALSSVAAASLGLAHPTEVSRRAVPSRVSPASSSATSRRAAHPALRLASSTERIMN